MMFPSDDNRNEKLALLQELIKRIGYAKTPSEALMIVFTEICPELFPVEQWMFVKAALIASIVMRTSDGSFMIDTLTQEMEKVRLEALNGIT